MVRKFTSPQRANLAAKRPSTHEEVALHCVLSFRNFLARDGHSTRDWSELDPLAHYHLPRQTARERWCRGVSAVPADQLVDVDHRRNDAAEDLGFRLRASPMERVVS